MTEKIPIVSLFLITLVSSLSAEFASNVYLSPISVKCEASGKIVTNFKCKNVPISTRDGKVSSLLVEVMLKKPLHEVYVRNNQKLFHLNVLQFPILLQFDVQLEHKFFTPFYIPLFSYKFEACTLLNATEHHQSIGNALDFALRFMPTIPREYIHACPYQGFNRFNLTFNFHDLIADVVASYFRGAVKIFFTVSSGDDDKMFQMELEIEPVEVA